MEAEVLIKKITKEVLNRLKEQFPNELITTSNRVKNKEVLLIIPEYAKKTEKFIQYLEKESTNEVISILAYNPRLRSDLPAKYIIFDIAEISTRNEIIAKFDDYNAIYCISPGIRMLENFRVLDDSNFIEWLVIHGLLNNLDVNILIDYNLNLKNLNPIQRRVKDLLESISKMGIKVENINCAAEIMVNQKSSHYVTGKDLITEKQIEKIYRDGQKELNAKRAIITPLAYDKARELGIKVTY